MPMNGYTNGGGAYDLGAIGSNIGKALAGALSGDSYRAGYEGTMPKLAQAAQAGAHADLYRQQAEEMRRRAQFQTPEFSTRIAGALAGLNDQQSGDLAKFQKRGNWGESLGPDLPQGQEGPPVPVQAQKPDWATPETVSRFNIGRAAHLMNLGGTGNTNAEQMADAFAKLLGQNRIDAAMADPKNIPTFGAAMAASQGNGQFHQGTNGVMNQFTGDETLNDVGKSAALENRAQANNANSSAALHRAQIPEVQARTELTRSKIGKGETITLPDGTVVNTGVSGIPPKLTEVQGKAQLFGSRAAEADRILAELEGKYSPAAINSKMAAESVWGVGGTLGAVGNKMLSKESQKAEQAQRDFVNAILRLESGAVISDQEFGNAKKQYFPQPGDSKEVLEQKARNRQLAIDGLRVMAGPAADRVRPSGPPSAEAQARHPALANVPDSALTHLSQNPHLLNAFAAKYGKEAADAARAFMAGQRKGR